jgi:hypothetical protein
MDYGIPLGRRFRALKLWFTLCYFGVEGIAEPLTEGSQWIEHGNLLVGR